MIHSPMNPVTLTGEQCHYLFIIRGPGGPIIGGPPLNCIPIGGPIPPIPPIGTI